MQVREVKCKTALSNSTLPGIKYSLNPYKGCQHNCAYCYVPNVLRIKRSKWGSFVDVKKNIPTILSKELRTKKPGVVAISTVTDPYQPIEKKYNLTRYCLEQLLVYNLPICIQTKSKLVTRDLDIISKFSDVEVMLSIATLNDYERKMLEPYSSSIHERLNALRRCSEMGIKTSVFFGPVYPTITSDDLPNIVDVFIKNGATEIMIDKFNPKPGVIDSVEESTRSNPLFLEKFSNNQTYYKLQKEKLYEICKKRKIKIVDAF